MTRIIDFQLRESEIKRLACANTQKNNYPLQQICSNSESSVPVLKVAERVKLPKVDRSGITGSEIANLGVSGFRLVHVGLKFVGYSFFVCLGFSH